MSRYADVEKLLPKMLAKYDHTKHGAIVATYSHMLEDRLSNDLIKHFLTQCFGVSDSADNEIKKQLICHGIDCDA